MKKTIWLLGAFFLGGTLLATTLATPVVAEGNAGPGNETTNLSENTTVSTAKTVFTATDDKNASAKSTAQFTVEAGQLTLVAVPDLNFGAVPPATIVNGGTQSLTNNTVDNVDNVNNVSSKGQSAFDGNNAGKLIVSDMRGTGKGWSLSISMDSDFKSENSTLRGLSLTLKATGSNSFFGSNNPLKLEGTTTRTTTSDIPIVVSTNSENSGVGDTTFDLNKPDFNLNTSDSASLTFPEKTNSNFTANKAYQSNVTWTLQVTPTT